MDYLIRLMNDADAHAISQWHYDGPYSFYDVASDPDDLAELLDAEARADSYWTVTDEQGALVGFFSLHVEGNVVEIGLGMRPDLTGKGNGLLFLQSGVKFMMNKYQPSAIILHVATFNQRAIRVYEKAGFATVQRLMRETNGGQHEFVKMVMHVE